MHIAALETIRSSDNDNLLWLVVETDTGISGLGEAFFAPGAVDTFLHEVAAPLVLGRDATRIGAINRELTRYPVGYASSGAEMRAAAALDNTRACRCTPCWAAAHGTASASTTPAPDRTTSPRRARPMSTPGSAATAHCRRSTTCMPSSTSPSAWRANCSPRASPA
jgi:hypothetical protein